jgi:hypothetical protein
MPDSAPSSLRYHKFWHLEHIPVTRLSCRLSPHSWFPTQPNSAEGSSGFTNESTFTRLNQSFHDLYTILNIDTTMSSPKIPTSFTTELIEDITSATLANVKNFQALPNFNAEDWHADVDTGPLDFQLISSYLVTLRLPTTPLPEIEGSSHLFLRSFHEMIWRVGVTNPLLIIPLLITFTLTVTIPLPTLQTLIIQDLPTHSWDYIHLFFHHMINYSGI